MNSKNMSDCVFDFIYGMAVNDALNRVSGIMSGDKANLLENRKIKEACEKYINSIISGCDEEKSFNIAVDEIKKNNNNNSAKKVNCLNFGKIQKLLNMITKYYYIKYYDNPDEKKKFGNCGTPMDSIMMTFVYESYYVLLHKPDSKDKKLEKPGFGREGWSKLDSREEYDAFQDTIKEIIRNTDPKLTPIEFDYIYWDIARNVKYDPTTGKERNKEDRIEQTQAVWKEFIKK